MASVSQLLTLRISTAVQGSDAPAAKAVHAARSTLSLSLSRPPLCGFRLRSPCCILHPLNRDWSCLCNDSAGLPKAVVRIILVTTMPWPCVDSPVTPFSEKFLRKPPGVEGSSPWIVVSC